MASVNKLILVGNLGNDPELRYLESGDAVVNLSVATNRSWKDSNGEWAEEVIWWRVDVWGDKAERVAEKVKKGDQVYVEGRAKPVRQYKRQDGTIGFSQEVAAHTVLKLGKRTADDGDSQLSADEANARGSVDLDVDDIPF